MCGPAASPAPNIVSLVSRISPIMAEGRIEILRTVAELHHRLEDWRAAGDSIGLVPTMGALHEGHFSLIERSTQENMRCVATLFVNPKQFGEGEDFDQYPRDVEGDAERLEGRGTDLLFLPDMDEIYPPGFTTYVSLPGIGDRLEGEFRPGFFTGVATVVTKLLLQAQPHKAYFGEKDYQQLCIIRRLVVDLNIPVEIQNCPTIREPDGLALSSRNAYLGEKERAAAPQLHAGLMRLGERLKAGEGAKPAIAAETAALLAAGFGRIDYLALCSEGDLEPLEKPNGPARLLAAAWLGGTRLIDNISVG